MDSLPVEILNEILLRIDRPSLFHASQVSHLWRDLSLKQVTPIKSEEEFEEACRRGDRLSIIKSTYRKEWLNNGLYYTCWRGHRELAELMIGKGADDWNWGLHGACHGGHHDLAELMISKGAYHLNTGLYYACWGGHREMVDLMISKGANNWNWGLRGACWSGHRDLLNLMIDKGATYCSSCYKPADEH